MSLLSYRISSIILGVGIFFIYVIFFKLNPSLEHESYVKNASDIRNVYGISLSTSPFYGSSDFYIGMQQDDVMSFSYAK